MNNLMLGMGDLKIEKEQSFDADPIIDSGLRVSIVSQITNIIETRISFLSDKIETYKAASKEEQDKLFYALSPIVRSYIYKDKDSYKPHVKNQYFERDIAGMIQKYKELLPYLHRFLNDKDQHLLHFLGLLKKNLYFLDFEKKEFENARYDFIELIKKDNKKNNKTKSVVFSKDGKNIATQQLNNKIHDLEQQYDFVFQDDHQILKTIQNLFFDKENKICTNIENDFYNRDINFSLENSKLSIFLEPKIVSLFRRYKIILTNFLKKEVAVIDDSMTVDLPEYLRAQLNERKAYVEEGLNNTQKSLASLKQPQVVMGDEGLEGCIQMYIDHYPLLQLKNNEFEEGFNKIAKAELNYVNFLKEKYGLLQRKKEILSSAKTKKPLAAKVSAIPSSNVSLKKQNIKLSREDEFDELKIKENELNLSIKGIESEITALNSNVADGDVKELEKVYAEEEALKLQEQELKLQEAALKAELEAIALLQEKNISAKKAQDIQRCIVEKSLKSNVNETTFIPVDIIINNRDQLLELFNNSSKITYDEAVSLLEKLGIEIHPGKGSHQVAVYCKHKISICRQHGSDNKILTYTNRSFICYGLSKILPTNWQNLSLNAEVKSNASNLRLDCSS